MSCPCGLAELAMMFRLVLWRGTYGFAGGLPPHSMSTGERLVPDQEQPRQGPSWRDAKADAKASKAYAKAQRPWYKKKRWIISLGLILIIALASAGSGGGSSNSGDSSGGGSSNSGGSSGGSSSKKDDGKSGAVGQALKNAGTTYKVTQARTTKVIGDPTLGGAKADGTFVVVSLQLTNNKSETKTFSDANAKIKTSAGKEYGTSDKAVLAFGDKSLLLKDIQPDLTTKGKLAFELPPSKVSGSTLVIEDIFGDGEIKVDLGL